MGENASPEECMRLHLPAFSGFQLTDNGAVLLPVFAMTVCAVLSMLVFFLRRSDNVEERRPRVAVQGGMPPVFPNGWIPVAESSQLKKGEVKPLTVIGKELVVFRNEDGEARVFDAYCPHMGAHLGVMGSVVDNCIECPFHGWRFHGDTGACTFVPYAAKGKGLQVYIRAVWYSFLPEAHQQFHWKTKTLPIPIVKEGAPAILLEAKTWICKELWGMVFIWYHADGEAPSWEIPADALGDTVERDSSWRFEHRIHTHIQDVAENGADIGHFNQVHWANSLVDGAQFKKTMGKTWKGRMFQHHWVTSWTPLNHDAMVTIKTSISVLGWKSNYLRYYIEARQVGPALVVIRIRGRKTHFMLVQSLIPEGPFNIRMVHKVFFQPQMRQLVRWIYVIGLRNMVDRDGIIWNSKAFLKKAVLLKEEHSVAAFRKWYSQFYSASSPTWQEIRDRSLEW